MNKRAVVFIAEGFEEVEALTPVDLLRRAGAEVCMAAVGESLTVTGRSGISVVCDRLIGEADAETADMLILPGGLPGVTNLGACGELCDLLRKFAEEGREVAAICAAPTLLGKLGILQGKKAICYPGMEDQLTGAEVTFDEVVRDGALTTSRGVGTAIPFALSLIGTLFDKETADRIAESIAFRKVFK